MITLFFIGGIFGYLVIGSLVTIFCAYITRVFDPDDEKLPEDAHRKITTLMLVFWPLSILIIIFYVTEGITLKIEGR